MLYNSTRKTFLIRRIDFATDRWGNYDFARHWLRSCGYGVGSMQRGTPTGAVIGTGILVSKWRNLSDADRAALDAVIFSDSDQTWDCPVAVHIYTPTTRLRYWAARHVMEIERPATSTPTGPTGNISKPPHAGVAA